jgi:hypothetical protein
MRRELIDHDLGQIALARIGNGGVVDQMRRIAGSQQREEIQPAFGTPGCEGSKLVVADMRAKAILGLVARAGIVNGDPSR